jgi:hypothetical protein
MGPWTPDRQSDPPKRFGNAGCRSGQVAAHKTSLRPTLQPTGSSVLSPRPLFTRIGQQRHEPRSLDRTGHRVLAGRRTTRLAAPYNATVPIDQLLQQLDVLVVDIHRTWTLAVDENRILLLRPNAGFRPFAGPHYSFHINSLTTRNDPSTQHLPGSRQNRMPGRIAHSTRFTRKRNWARSQDGESLPVWGIRE